MSTLLDTKLDRVATVVGEMKRNLHLDEDAPIEEVSAATDLRNLLNVFIQEEEPEGKDGVWLQTVPFEFRDFTLDENLHFSGEIEGLDKWPKDTMNNKYIDAVASNTDAFYLIYSSTWYKYPYDNYTTENWHKTSAGVGCACADGDIIYFVDSNSKLNSINTKTKETESLGTIPTSSYVNYPFMSIFNNIIYLGKSGQLDTIDCFDLNTKTFFTLPGHGRYSKTSNSKCDNLPVWNGKIFFHNVTSGSGYSNYQTLMYDIEKATWTNFSPMNSEVAQMVVIGNDMYALMGGSNTKLYRINLVDGTKTTIALPFSTDGYDRLFNMNGQLTYWSAGQRRTFTFAKDTSAYDHDTIVLLQGKYKDTSYQTCLYNVPDVSRGNFKWGFYDAFPYINGDFIKTIPTYYGNGTEWVKIKN